MPPKLADEQEPESAADDAADSEASEVEAREDASEQESVSDDASASQEHEQTHEHEQESDESGPEYAVAEVDDVGDPDGFFDGVETDPGSDDVDTSGFFDGEEAGSGPAPGGDAPGGGPAAAGDDSGGPSVPDIGGKLAGRINAGCARAAVIGMDEGEGKDSLRGEFEETFETFMLGHYSSEVAQEYLDADIDDINPVWGLVGAMLICACVVVWRRPDVDANKLAESTRKKVGSLKLPSRN